MSDRISLIHTADLHLGRSFHDLGAQGPRLRRRLLAALDRIAAAALDRRVDLVLIAGDLFDSPHPGREALAALAGFFARLSAAGTRTVVIPGTHDPPGTRAFSRAPFTSGPGSVHLLLPERPVCILDDLDLAVAAWFPARDRAREWIGPDPGWGQGRGFRIVMAHGSVLTGLGDDGPDDLIPAAVLADPDVHYLALGHHHSFRMAAKGPVPAYYPGSPEMLAFDQREAGHAAHVVLERNRGEVTVDVQKIRVGSLRGQQVEIAAEEIEDGSALTLELQKLADPDLYLEVVVTGVVASDTWLPDFRELEEIYAESFFKLRVRDRTGRARPGAGPGAGPDGAAEGSVLAEFIRRVGEKIEASEGPEQKEWEDALRLGVHYLSGGDQKR